MVRQAVIRDLTCHLPERCLTNEQLSARWQQWSAEAIYAKTGIRQRRIADASQCASDLAQLAAEKMFSDHHGWRDEIDILILCTQSPDYLLPTTACLLQHRLGLRQSCMAFDINLGCSGYIYGLAVAKALLESGQGSCALLLTADTYSKFINEQDASVSTLFGDAATATLLQLVDRNADGRPSFGPFVFGTDGSGAKNLILRGGGCRHGRFHGEAVDETLTAAPSLTMNGPEIFAFTLRAVPEAFSSVLDLAGLSAADIDLFVFHQANRFILETLRKKLAIPEDRFVVDLEDIGNTVSCTIPISLKRCLAKGRLSQGMRVLLIGFGVGYSWGATVLTWDDLRFHQGGSR